MLKKLSHGVQAWQRYRKALPAFPGEFIQVRHAQDALADWTEGRVLDEK
jgi:hypothetical protein